MSAAFPPRSLGAPSSHLIARRENSAAALRSLAGSAGTWRQRHSPGNGAAALRELGRLRPPGSPDQRRAAVGQPRRRGWSPFRAGFALRRFLARPLRPRRLGSDSPG